MLPLWNRLAQKQAVFTIKMQDTREKINLLEAEIAHEKKVISSFEEKIVRFSQLKGLTERLSMSLSLEDTSKTLSVEVNRLFGDKDAVIILYLFQSKTGELGISSSQKDQMNINIKAKRGDIFDQWIVKAMQPLLIEDTKADFRFDADKIVTEDSRKIRSLISAPLMVGHKALGILRVDSPRENQFTTEDLRFLTTIGDVGALAVENAQLYEHVEELAIKDGLTNLYFKKYFLDRLSEEISRHMRHKSEMALLMIDLDFFKKYNDQFGHTAGDIVLKTVASTLLEVFNQPGNFVARYGGEEFCVLLPDCSKNKAAQLAESLRKKIEAQTITLRREETSMSISVGIAVFPKDAQLKEELIHKADQALYRAKKEGRNRVCTA